jgi:hypothetical protein
MVPTVIAVVERERSKAEEEFAEEDNGESSRTEAFYNVNQPLEVIKSEVVFLCLVLQRKLFSYMCHNQ